MGTLAFPALILVFFALILWIIIGCKGWWFAKFWLINISLIFVLIFWHSISSYLGWPSEEPLPETFRFLAFHPDEPKSLYVLTDKHEGQEKFSLGNVFSYKSDDTIRLYRIPYSKDMHEKLEAAAERAMKGGYVIGSKNQILDAEQLRNLQKDAQNQGRDAGGNELGGYLGGLNFYILPPSLFMKKPSK